MLQNPDVPMIVVEHQACLTRFGFNTSRLWLESKGCEIVVSNEAAKDQEDLRQDFVSLVISFVARLYGLRRSKRRTKEISSRWQDEDS